MNLSGPDSVADATTTDAAGNYTFTELRAGEYHLDISGYDADRVRVRGHLDHRHPGRG